VRAADAADADLFSAARALAPSAIQTCPRFITITNTTT
jgi:hypothetical protein